MGKLKEKITPFFEEDRPSLDSYHHPLASVIVWLSHLELGSSFPSPIPTLYYITISTEFMVPHLTLQKKKSREKKKKVQVIEIEQRYKVYKKKIKNKKLIFFKIFVCSGTTIVCFTARSCFCITCTGTNGCCNRLNTWTAERATRQSKSSTEGSCRDQKIF